MTDNTFAPAFGGQLASDDISGVRYQIVKLAVGGNDTANPLSTDNPLPVIIMSNSVSIAGRVIPVNENLVILMSALTAPSGATASTPRLPNSNSGYQVPASKILRIVGIKPTMPGDSSYLVGYADEDQGQSTTTPPLTNAVYEMGVSNYSNLFRVIIGAVSPSTNSEHAVDFLVPQGKYPFLYTQDTNQLGVIVFCVLEDA